jgi:hypothetical protein
MPEINNNDKFLIVEDIASLCYEANADLRYLLGEDPGVSWPDLSQEEKDSYIVGVCFRLANPDSSIAKQHESWMAQKKMEGWKYGEVKDPIAKTHPQLVDYGELPSQQYAKDFLFKAIVNGLSQFVKIG